MNKQAAYKRALVTQLYFGGGLSCAELSNLTPKSMPLTTRLLAEMIKDGCVVEKGHAHSTGGCRPQRHSLKPQLLYIVCVAMDQLITKITLIDGRNHLVEKITEVEFSHLPIFANNKIYNCGKTGGLETETSLLYITEKPLESVRDGRLFILKNLSPAHKEETASAIMEAARKGDKPAVDLFSEAGYKIGKGVAILIHLINPELIVLTGRGVAAGRAWLAPIQQAVNEHCIPKIAENINLGGRKRSSRLQEDTFSQ